MTIMTDIAPAHDGAGARTGSGTAEQASRRLLDGATGLTLVGEDRRALRATLQRVARQLPPAFARSVWMDAESDIGSLRGAVEASYLEALSGARRVGAQVPSLVLLVENGDQLSSALLDELELAAEVALGSRYRLQLVMAATHAFVDPGGRHPALERCVRDRVQAPPAPRPAAPREQTPELLRGPTRAGTRLTALLTAAALGTCCVGLVMAAVRFRDAPPARIPPFPTGRGAVSIASTDGVPRPERRMVAPPPGSNGMFLPVVRRTMPIAPGPSGTTADTDQGAPSRSLENPPSVSGLPRPPGGWFVRSGTGSGDAGVENRPSPAPDLSDGTVSVRKQPTSAIAMPDISAPGVPGPEAHGLGRTRASSGVRAAITPSADGASMGADAAGREDSPHGLLILARAGDTLPALYREVYRGVRPPPLETVQDANPGPMRPNAVLIFPAPPDGWSRRH
ncbi:hypothetical protein [Rhizosaccharibacter radicis]|uniref:Type IV / VI secretion system DotU domain-containing protein n=1 Tax=Rhizosaccharibacter radicis TaxID=2782605 RepID=A0ABT1VT68_9PROT|nr:hypothetical protein [Acetobacteraceae bacterium KSS12]